MANMRVPWVLPIKSGSELADGSQGRVPAIVRTTLGLKPGLPVSEIQRLGNVADTILERRRGELLAFFRAASAGTQIGIIPITSRMLNLRELQARYTSQQGVEILDITIYPDLVGGPPIETLDFPWDYLELRFEWSIDDGTVDGNTGLKNMNRNRGLYTRAKIRRPKKIPPGDPLFIYARQVGGAGEQLYFPWKSDPSSEYYIDSDLAHTDGFYNSTWVGAEMAYGLGKSIDFAGTQRVQGAYTQYGDRYDGDLYIMYAGYYTGYSVEAKHYGSYIIDLRNFPPGQPIDIELRSFWGGSFYLDPADGSPFPDVKLSYHLWSGGTVHWPQYEEQEVRPAGPPIQLEDRADPTFKDIVGGVTYGPYTYHRLQGASTVGLGGNGGTGDGVTFDESEHRDTLDGTEPGGAYIAPAARVNTPGIYTSQTAGGAYSPSGSWRPTPGMYYFYCPPGYTGGAVVAISTAGGVIKFTRSDGTTSQDFIYPQDFEIALWTPQFSGGAFTGYGWQYGGTILPEAAVIYPKANDFFTHKGGGERKGVLCQGKQVDFYELPANGAQRNEAYYTPGVYFGNVTYDPVTQSVKFSASKGPDPDLRGGPGPAESEFYANGTP